MNVEGFVSIERPDGKVFEFGNGFYEIEIDGAGTLTREIYTEAKGIGHGAIVIGSRIPPRSMLISSDTFVTDNGDLRDEVDEFFRYPEDEHKIIVSYKNKTRWIKGQIEVFDLPLGYVGAPQAFNLSVLCTDPLFRSMDEFGKDIANILPMWGWPFFSPMNPSDYNNPVASADPYVTKGNITGVYEFEQKAFLANDGDFPTFPRAVITTTAQTSHIILYVDEARLVIIEDTLNPSDTLEVDFGEETVFKNGVNINSKINRQSVFFSIPRGGIDFRYAASKNVSAIHVTIYYNQLYKGV